MTQASPQASLNSSRLIRLLSDLAMTDTGASQRNFGERLGNLIDFSDSIILSAAHGELPGISFEKRSEGVDVARDEFLKVRVSLVESIIKSTSPSTGGTRIKLPKLHLEPNQSVTTLLEYEPYYRFYASHQRDIDYKIKSLRHFLRDEISGYSPKLAQLSVLDTALDDTLLVHTNKYFGVIPKLLQKRFKFLIEEHQRTLSDPEQDITDTWIQPGGWLEQFCKEMQGLLLAELEVRLQPVLGLVKALNEEVNKNQ